MSMRDKLTLFLLVAMSFFLMCDVFITPAIINELQAEYSISAAVVGWVGSAFVLLGAIVGIVFGYKADHRSRKKLLVITVLIGEIPCLLTGIYFFTETFAGFAIMRMLTGIGVGGIYPLTFSLVGDYFRDKHRATASASIDLAWGIGMIAGPLLASYALASDYGWRLAFILAALPNFPIVLLFALIAKEPKRGRTETQLQNEDGQVDEYQHKIKRSDFALIVKNKTNLYLFLQGIPGSIPWGLLPFWLMMFFTESRDFSRDQATYIWEIFGISAGFGGFMWAILGDHLFMRNPRYLPMLCMIGVFTGLIPCAILFNISFTSMLPYLVFAGLAGLFISIPSSNCKAMLMNVNRPEHRGSVFAIYNLSDNIGKGLGPAIGGMLIAISGNYLLMINMAISLWLICGCLYLGAMYSITHDRKTMLNLMQQRATSPHSVRIKT